MSYRLSQRAWGPSFAFPAKIVDKYIKLSGAASLKVLLVILRHPDEDIDIKKIASRLNLSQADAQDALNYWIECGVIESDEHPAEEPARADEPLPSETPAKPPVPQMPAVPEHKPKMDECRRLVAGSEPLKYLLRQTEQILGKMLTSADIATLVTLYDYAGLPIEVILMVVQYCVNAGKTKMYQIEKTAYEWLREGIDTLEAAERHLKTRLLLDKHIKHIKSAFGIYDRNLTPAENKYIKTWFEDYGFELELIKLAYEKTVDNTGKLSFPYINKILASWHKKGIKTPEAAAGDDRRFSDSKKSAPSFDLDEYERFVASSSPKLD